MPGRAVLALSVILASLTIALAVAATHYHYGGWAVEAPEILIPPGYEHPVIGELYILRVEPLALNKTHAERILSILGWGSTGGVEEIGNGYKYFEKNRRGLVDFELSNEGRLRFYRVKYSYTGFAASFNETIVAEKAGKLLDRIIRVYREAGFNAISWRLALSRVSPDIVVTGNVSSGTVTKKYGRLAALFNAYYQGVRVWGLYRIEFFPDGDVAAVFLDLWNVKPVKKLRPSQLLSVEDALKQHAGLSLLERLAGNRNALNITGVELVYTPIWLGNGTGYLIPVYRVVFENTYTVVRVPAVEDEELYQIVKAHIESATAATATAETETHECSPPSTSLVAEITVKTGDKTITLHPSRETRLSREVLDKVLQVIEDRVALVLRCAYTEQDMQRKIASIEEYIHIVFKNPVNLELREPRKTTCVELVELYLTPLPSENNATKHTLYIKTPTTGHWNAYWLEKT